MPHGYPPWSGITKKTVYSLPVDMGELAARLGSISTYDRRGDTLLLDDFEGGLSKGLKTSFGTGAEAKLSAISSRSGSFSMKLVPGSEVDSWAGYMYYLPYPLFSHLGIEAAFTVDSDTAYFELWCRIYDGTNRNWAAIRYDEPNKKILYLDSAGSWEELIDDVRLYKDITNFHNMKMVIDLENMAYHRVLVDKWAWIAGELDVRVTASALSPRIYFAIMHYGNVGTNPVAYADNVIITQNEP